ncbi:PHB depolymerase family esterase [Gordonia sp. ABSL1-1]|uniref:alpha/beta hydrolase family esterase n=1 Tax=Gordonia sp. ABSL1-1 TaxID=3053923 RepID=UPI0025731529|nr:prolyl oligopeptidase family serine peptidase [Gordonia sp. ABSL1-1]MDL9937559.1 PHB depolymerase family esterase [Gordonia sp. ABSL1-1]
MFRRSALRIFGPVAVAVMAAMTIGATAAATPSSPDNSLAPVPSSGCKTSTAAPGHSIHPFSAVGRSGDYLLEVPRVAPRTPVPVVFDVHGYLQPGVIQSSWSQMADYGARHGFAVVTPETHVLPPKWDIGEHGRDIGFFAALLDHVEKTLCVDKRRVYMTGLSMGGFTSSSVACQLADRFAAVAPVAGLQNYTWCKPSRHVPVIAFHGTGDEILPYSGGIGPRGKYLPALDGSLRTAGQEQADSRTYPKYFPSRSSIPNQTAAWAARNGCAATPTTRKVTRDVSRTVYRCAADSSVELYTVFGGGHNWPGGDPTLAVTPITGPITSSVSATAIIWDFFRKHPLTGPVR